MPGLGARLGRGGSTTALQSLADSDCIVIMGSNMAEAHPVGFRFVLKAKQRGATVMHIDPRFSRTSALADRHVALRSGTDLAFLGGLINYTINSERWNSDPFFKEYVTHYTNAAAIIDSRYQDTEDLEGIFSGFMPEQGWYNNETWQYAGSDASTDRQQAMHVSSRAPVAFVGRETNMPQTDPTLQDPQCVFQIVKRHFARYTPEMMEQICGVPQDEFIRVAETVLANSGRDRTSVFCYAMAWTQHSTGSQTIGCAALLQLLLGNMGRPGGGIMALRGHATIQGSTDIPTLYDLLPGYLQMPTDNPNQATIDGYLRINRPSTGTWYNMPSFLISLLKAWYGDAATAENDYCWELVPKIGGDYSFQHMLTMMKDGIIKGLFCLGQNPAVGGQNAVLGRQALANLDWLVVRDAHEIESAAFWYDAPEVKRGDVRPQDIKTEIILMPAALSTEKDGTFTNTQRVVQWHEKIIDPPGDARSESWFIDQLAKRLRALYAGDDGPLGRQIAAMEWNYSTAGPHDDPVMEEVVKEVNGYFMADRSQVSHFSALKDDGSTACGCWIYSGMMPAADQNLTKRRRGDERASLEWGWAWPSNIHLLYNRCSADPQGRPWSERKAWVWWDEEKGEWTGYDTPDFPRTKRPDYQPPAGARGSDAQAGDSPFGNIVDGKGWLFVPTGLKDGPLPTHYEPRESPVKNLLYPNNPFSPAAIYMPRPDNRYHQEADPRFPYVITTYRLTEHQTAGGMTRWVPWLAELQPEGFVEISPELAEELGINNGDPVVVSTLRSEVESRALVTERMQPFEVAGKRVHQVGMPWHYGYGGLAKGGTANDLTSLIEDPNSQIHESKAFTCNLRKGRLTPIGEGTR